ncbi:MAG TPA: hypothetical protein VJC00_00220 [Candidatus Nanoarchaeia archaeon]|nr:hypothetical protein [Candidatus Nanoarchaeia archaeon]
MAVTKRGQVSLFIIIGVVGIILIAIYVYTRGAVTEQPEDELLDVQPVKFYLNNCLKSSAKDAFALVGLRGGKRNLEEPYFSSNLLDTNYWYYIGEMKAVSLEDIKRNLEEETAANLEKCFSNFLEPGLQIEKDELNISILVFDDDTQIDAQWPINIISDSQRIHIDYTETMRLGVRLKAIHDLAENITSMVSNKKLEFGQLIAEGMNITADITPETQLFLITDPKSMIDSQPYGFVFATKIK